jgi:hypothetical protein
MGLGGEAALAAYLVEQSGWDALPEEISRAKVEFYQRRRAEFQRLGERIQALDRPEP